MYNIKNAVEKSIKTIRTSITGTITSIIKKDKKVYVSASNEEEIRDVKIISPPGFFSLPLQNQTAQVLFNNKSSKRASIIGVEHDSVPRELEPGEAIMYSNSGTYIKLGEKIEFSDDIELDEMKLKTDIKGTVKSIIFKDNKIYKINHNNSSGVTIREDEFTYEINKIIEKRTLLNNGKTLTFIYHMDTLETEII